VLTDQVLLAQVAGGNPLQNPLILILGMFGILYFLMIRPQQKQLKEHKALLAALKKGDTVVTQGGIIGRIFLVADKEVQIEVASNVKLRVLKTSVQTVLKDPSAEAKSDEPKAEKESK
jgi:preprotein translocase subunit YajC